MRFTPISAVLVAALTSGAFAQADQPALFVANNGNLEGAVSSMSLSGGVPALVQKLVLGIKVSGGPNVPGTNAYEMSLSPDGRHLAISHATALTTEQVSLVRIHPDLSLELLGVFSVPDSPLDVQWIDDTFLAVAKSSVSGNNEVAIYEIDFMQSPPGAVERDRQFTGLFSTYLEKHPTLRVLYTQDSSLSGAGARVSTWEVSSSGTLTLIDEDVTAPVYSLEIAVSPRGDYLFTTGGISSGGHAINGFFVAANGSLDPTPGSPYFSSGQSPADCEVSDSGDYLVVGHGTDATVRTFFITGAVGNLIETGALYDLGTQGSIGDVREHDGMVYVTDSWTVNGTAGVHTFELGANGELTKIGQHVSTGATSANAIAYWEPDSCPADCDGSGSLDVFDFLCFQNAFVNMAPNGDCDNSGTFDVFDFLCFQNQFAAGCN